MKTNNPAGTGAIALLLVLALAACDKSVTEAAASDDIVMVESNDPAMNRAFEKARKTLDEFLRLAESPRPGTEAYSIKVALSDDDNTEYFWVADFAVDGDKFSGVLDNEPQLVLQYKLGQHIEFSRDQVVDWSYLEPEARRMHGNFTGCALLEHEDPADAEEFKEQYGLQCD